jgi:hypothetical protein
MPKIIKVSENEWHFYCPGCECNHAFDKRWQFNNDFEKPTLHPSYLLKGWIDSGNTVGRCHSYITDGKIKFLTDSTHKLSGHNIELPECE